MQKGVKSPLPSQSSSAALQFTHPTPSPSPARVPGEHQPLVLPCSAAAAAPSCTGCRAARVLLHSAEQQKLSLTLLPLFPPSP